jgi:hypothetical protein
MFIESKMQAQQFIETEAKELELSDIVRINYRSVGNDIGDTLPIVGFVSREYDGNGKLYLKNVDLRYKSSRWGERGYDTKRIEYLRKLSPLGKMGVPMNAVWL